MEGTWVEDELFILKALVVFLWIKELHEVIYETFQPMVLSLPFRRELSRQYIILVDRDIQPYNNVFHPQKTEFFLKLFLGSFIPPRKRVQNVKKWVAQGGGPDGKKSLLRAGSKEMMRGITNLWSYLIMKISLFMSESKGVRQQALLSTEHST